MEDIETVKQLTEMRVELAYVRRQVDSIAVNLEKNYVSREVFMAEVSPLKTIVYGIVGVILLSFAGTMATFFIK